MKMNVKCYLCYVFTFYVTVVYASVYGANKDAPHWLSISPLDEGGVYVVWSPVIPDDTERIAGYKILMWEIKEKTERKFQLINGDQSPGLLREDRTEELYDVNVTPNRTPKTITIDNPESNSATIKDITGNVLYEIRIHSYGLKNSSISEPWRFKILEGEGYKNLVQRNPDVCMVTLASKTNPDEDIQINNIYF